jgi:putative ABC transport system permease protein
MMLLKMSIKNILGAGLRTWLNVVVLSFAFVMIILSQGLIQGMNLQAEEAMVASEIGGGQYWQADYDPYDPLTLQDAHAPVPESIQALIKQGRAVPVLAVPGNIYPNGRIQAVMLKGIDPGQTLFNIPTSSLDNPDIDFPILIGSRMAKNTGLRVGDLVTVQWRDVNGTFDARDAEIVFIMQTSVQTIDTGKIWLPLEILREMTGLPGEATLVTLPPGSSEPPEVAGWTFRGLEYLMSDIRAMVQSKSVGSGIIYAILMLLAMLAIFDTQVLSIFRRRKEMGTLMALGFTRGRIIRLFTLEGAMHGVLAALVGAVYGVPLLSWMVRTGWTLPGNTDGYGFALGEKLFPSYSLGLVMGTTVLVLVVTTIVSFLPTRRIAKLKPTEALHGRGT